MIIGAIGEWIVGNTFPFVVFGTFGKCPFWHPTTPPRSAAQLTRTLSLHTGAFWLTFGGTLVPSFNSYGAYVTNPTQMAGQDGNPGNPLGLQTPGFNSSFAFFLLFMGALSSIIYLPLVHTYGETTNADVNVHRIRLLHLPHLLPPHQYRLLPHLPLPCLRLRLSRRRILEPGARVRECGKYDRCRQGWEACRCKPASLLPMAQIKTPHSARM